MSREMTRDEILAMKPGRELDKLVGEFMGYEYVPYQLNGRYVGKDYFINKDGEPLYDWSPSTDTAAAWEVVEMFSYIDIHRYDDFFACAIYPIGNSAVMRARGKTMPEAICKAALLAVMEG